MQAIHVSQHTAVAVRAMRKHRCDSEACCEGRLQGAGTVMLISSPSPPPLMLHILMIKHIPDYAQHCSAWVTLYSSTDLGIRPVSAHPLGCTSVSHVSACWLRTKVWAHLLGTWREGLAGTLTLR